MSNISQGAKSTQIEKEINGSGIRKEKRTEKFEGEERRKKDIIDEEFGAASSLVRVASLFHMPVRALPSHISLMLGCGVRVLRIFKGAVKVSGVKTLDFEESTTDKFFSVSVYLCGVVNRRRFSFLSCKRTKAQER